MCEKTNSSYLTEPKFHSLFFYPIIVPPLLDPFGGATHANDTTPTVLGGTLGGSFETFAYDIRNPDMPHFFVTEDFEDGALRRFTPSNVDWENDPSSMLYDQNGTMEYLSLWPDFTDLSKGTYWWTTDQSKGRFNARLCKLAGRLCFVRRIICTGTLPELTHL